MLGAHPGLVMVAVQHVGLLVMMQQGLSVEFSVQHVGLLVMMQQGLSVQFAVQHVGLLVMMQQGLSVQFYQGIRGTCPNVLELSTQCGHDI